MKSPPNMKNAWGLTNLIPHASLILILLLHLALSLSYASLIPLGEAPDEGAQLNYARFIAAKQRLPATLEERQAADYRANWPPLYHALIALPVGWVGEAPPARLKAVGDTARRLIPTNGQTIAAFIHTDDEAWPWRGLPLAWHLSRFVSVGLTALAVTVTYLIAWHLTRRRDLAALAAGIQAFIPQVLFIGSVVNDDNLLVLLSGLVLLVLVRGAQRDRLFSVRWALGLGLLLGLATVAKYNALPLWGAVAVWYGYHLIGRRRSETSRSGERIRPSPPNPLSQNLGEGRSGAQRRTGVRAVVTAVAILAGAALSGGWWFIFIWRHFNQVEQLGWLRGSLAALVAGTSDASLRNLAAGSNLTLPGFVAWLEWFTTLFQSFWGRFGGSGSIEFPGWVYWLLAPFCLLAIFFLSDHRYAKRLISNYQPRHRHASAGQTLPITNYPSSSSPPPLPPRCPVPLFLLTPLFFLPLPMLRFILTGGSIVETAQGRHLFPALPAIALGLAWGLSRIPGRILTPFASQRTNEREARPTTDTKPFSPLLPCAAAPLLLLVILLVLSLYALPLIRNSYPPPIPLRTVAEATTAENELAAKLTGDLTLVGYDLGPVEKDVLPLTLVWQAEAVPAQDYLINLTLTDATGQPIGGWLGHPVGGRYPSRAWDQGDVLRHSIPVPLLPNLPVAEATLTLQLIDAFGQPAAEPLRLTKLSLPTTSPLTQEIEIQNVFWTPSPDQLRADHLPANSPFTYRSTLSFMLPNTITSPTLVAPDGQAFSPDQFLTNQTHSLAHFVVAAHWPSGDYHLAFETTNGFNPEVQSKIQNRKSRHRHVARGTQASEIENRPRQFELPPMQHTVNANFGGLATLLGYDLPRRRVKPGQSFPVTLYWRAETTMGQDLAVFNHLLDSTLTQRGGRDRIPLNHYTTLLWVPGEIVADTYEVPVEASAPASVYWLDVGLYPTERPDFSLPLIEAGQPIDRNSVPVGPIKVGGPPPDVILSEANPQYPVKVTFGNQLTLLGFDLLDDDGNPILIGQNVENPQSPISTGSVQSPGEASNLHLYWQADTIPTADYTVFVHLLDGQNNLVAQFDGAPADGAYPTSLWDPGEIIVDRRSLSTLPSGRYSLKVGLYQPDTGERLPLPQAEDDTLNLTHFEIRQE